MTPDYQAALRELQIAQQQFDEADPSHIDIAILRLKAAEMRFDVAVREAKKSETHLQMRKAVPDQA